MMSDEFLISCEFAENYAFVPQNSVQSFHWNNDQATVFTVVVYFKELGELKHRKHRHNIEQLSEWYSLRYAFQKADIDNLKKMFKPKMCTILGQHFKNE